MAESATFARSTRSRDIADEAAKREALLRFQERIAAKGGVKDTVGKIIERVVRKSESQTARLTAELSGLGEPERLRAMADEAADEIRTGKRRQPAAGGGAAADARRDQPDNAIGADELLSMARGAIAKRTAGPAETAPGPKPGPAPDTGPAEPAEPAQAAEPAEPALEADGAAEDGPATEAEVHREQRRRAEKSAHAQIASELDAMKASDPEHYRNHIGMKLSPQSMREGIAKELDALRGGDVDAYRKRIGMKKSPLTKGAVDKDGTAVIDPATGRQKQVPDTYERTIKAKGGGTRVITVQRRAYAPGEEDRARTAYVTDRIEAATKEVGEARERIKARLAESERKPQSQRVDPRTGEGATDGEMRVVMAGPDGETPADIHKWVYADGEEERARSAFMTRAVADAMAPSLTGGGVIDGTMPVDAPPASRTARTVGELVDSGPLRGLHIPNAEETANPAVGKDSPIGGPEDAEIRVIVTGALDWANELKLRDHDWRAAESLEKVLDAVARRAEDPYGESRLVLHVREINPAGNGRGFGGDAKTAEEAAIAWAEDHGIECVKYSADWRPTELGGEGRQAGANRNVRMLEEGRPHLVVHFPTRLPAKGPEHLVRTAQTKGVPVEVGTMRGQSHPISEVKAKGYDPGERYWEGHDGGISREEPVGGIGGAELLAAAGVTAPDTTGEAPGKPGPPAPAEEAGPAPSPPGDAAATGSEPAGVPREARAAAAATEPAVFGGAELLARARMHAAAHAHASGGGEKNPGSEERTGGSAGRNGGSAPHPKRGAGLEAGGTHPNRNGDPARKKGTQTPGS